MVQARKGKPEEAAGAGRQAGLGDAAAAGRQAELGNAAAASREERPGTGALCPEAQADGVPCFELGRDCEVCEHARLGEAGTLTRGSRKNTR
jgi:hypothetical protein